MRSEARRRHRGVDAASCGPARRTGSARSSITRWRPCAPLARGRIDDLNPCGPYAPRSSGGGIVWEYRAGYVLCGHDMEPVHEVNAARLDREHHGPLGRQRDILADSAYFAALASSAEVSYSPSASPPCATQRWSMLRLDPPASARPGQLEPTFVDQPCIPSVP
jgi:hypothetical protein